MELRRFEISSVFVGNMGFPAFFDKDFGFRYSNKGARSCASYGFVAAFCDHLIGQSVAPLQMKLLKALQANAASAEDHGRHRKRLIMSA
jgi:hypothetical protein